MIALINPPNPPDAVSNKDMMGGFGQLYPKGSPTKVPPLDMAYIAGMLKSNNVEFKVFECLGSDLTTEALISEIKILKPGIIGLRTSTPTAMWDLEVAKKIKSEVDSKIFLFGPHVNIYTEESLAPSQIDGLVLGEPEYIFSSLATKGIEKTDGICFKKNGEIIRKQDIDKIKDLDTLPFPAWEFFPYQSYTIGKYLQNITPYLPVLTSRGCPFNCGYCPYPLAQGTKWRKRSADNVIKELQHINEDLKVNAILFRDPEFTLDRKRTVDICNGILDKKLNIKWRIETRIDTIDKELIELMAKAGCIGINMGIESVDESVLKNIKRKPFALSDGINKINACKNNNIDAYVFFILGLPGETIKTSIKTIRYARRLNPSFAQFTVATPYKGTYLYDWAIKNKFIEEIDLSQITGFETTMGNENISKEKLDEIFKFAYEFIKLPPLKDVLEKSFNPFNILRYFKHLIILKFKELQIIHG